MCAAAFCGVLGHPRCARAVATGMLSTCASRAAPRSACSPAHRRCVDVAGPEGGKEVRALAFTSTGSALLAAYPDGLRTFTLDPLVQHDTADVQWKQVGGRDGRHACMQACLLESMRRVWHGWRQGAWQAFPAPPALTMECSLVASACHGTGSCRLTPSATQTARSLASACTRGMLACTVWTSHGCGRSQPQQLQPGHAPHSLMGVAALLPAQSQAQVRSCCHLFHLRAGCPLT